MQEDKQELNTAQDSNPPENQSSTEGRQSGIKSFKSAKSSNLQVSFTLFKSFIGTGVLALPYAYKTAGAGLAIIVTIFIGLLLTHCFLLLLKTVDDKAGKSKMSLQTLTQEVVGEKGRYLVQALLFIEQTGCCVGILIFTKDFLNHVLCSYEVTSLCNNTPFNLVFALSLVVPLSLINNMHYFYIPSLAANFFIMIGLMVQMYYNSQVVSEDPQARANIVSGLGQFNFSSLHLFFGVALFSFEGVGVTLSIRDSMEKPQDLPKLLKKQMFMLTAIYMIFAATSCLVLGDKLEDIVFFSLPTDDPFYLLIQILYAVSALCTYPIQLFPAVRMIENSAALKFKLFTETGRNRNKKLRYITRLSLIGLIFLVAYTAQSFHLFLNLLGSCVFTFLGLGLPIWLYLAQFKERVSKKEKWLNYAVLGISATLGAVGCVTSLIGLFSYDVEMIEGAA